MVGLIDWLCGQREPPSGPVFLPDGRMLVHADQRVVEIEKTVERVVYRDRIVEGRAYAEQVWRRLVALADNAYPPNGWVSYGTPEQTYAQWQIMGHYATQMRKVADDFYTAMAWPWFEEGGDGGWID